jgi:hypothetical protein
MKILFYASYTEANERVILIHKADMPLDAIPEKVKSEFKSISPESKEIDITANNSLWWLTSETSQNLQKYGYDRFIIRITTVLYL